MKTWLDNFLANRLLLSRIVGRIVRPDEIEDIVQETFVLSYIAARNQKIGNPRAFMTKIARNIALNYVSRSERKLNRSMEDLDERDMASLVDSVESRYESEERFLAFCRGVAELPVACRRVFILKKVYGLTQIEIANYLNLSPRTVEKHVEKGMLMTAEYMLSQGHDARSPDEASQESYPAQVRRNLE